jgi:hypothetical protein
MDTVDILVGAVLTALAVGLISLMVWGLFLFPMHQNAAFNKWYARCHADGGLIQPTREGFTSSEYECFKDGKIIDHQN